MLGFSSRRFRSSVAEAALWCRIKTAGSDSPEGIRERHALYTQAEQKWEQARESANRDALKITDTKEWQHGMALLQRVRDLLGPIGLQLRSNELKPSVDIDELRGDALWEKAVNEVVAKRSLLLDQARVGKDDKDTGGELLLYSPSENLACGAAEVSSNGFFDVNNVPPWDIWVDFSAGSLVSWVSPALVDIAQMGIDVNPESCIRWADS